MTTEVAADFPTGKLQVLNECHSIVPGNVFLVPFMSGAMKV